jgi:uncharacterized membrane protein YozB (DUF420 family)
VSEPSKAIQWIVWGGVGATVIGIACAFVISRSRLPSQPQPNAVARPEILFDVGDFTLTNQLGESFGLADLKGKVWLADIVFTSCAGPCPEMMRRMAELQTAVPSNQPVRFVTLTTHPEVDTPEVFRRYGQRFGVQSKRWHLLTGSKKQIATAALDGLKLTALDKELAQQENPNDLFIHSTIFVLIDKKGRAREVFESDAPDMKPRMLEAIDKVAKEVTLYDLPKVNAGLNALSAVLLTIGFIAIKRGNKTIHRNCMVGALTCSAIFLGCYLYYHFHAGRTVFKDPAWFRPIYLTMLLTHTILAVAILPMIVVTVVRAAKQRFEAHKRIARWTWPIWMYVSITGVLIYFLLYQIFPQR